MVLVTSYVTSSAMFIRLLRMMLGTRPRYMPPMPSALQRPGGGGLGSGNGGILLSGRKQIESVGRGACLKGFLEGSGGLRKAVEGSGGLWRAVESCGRCYPPQD